MLQRLKVQTKKCIGVNKKVRFREKQEHKLRYMGKWIKDMRMRGCIYRVFGSRKGQIACNPRSNSEGGKAHNLALLRLKNTVDPPSSKIHTAF